MSPQTRVKICGLTEEAGLEACISGKADWVGFVFFQRSPRHVSPERARDLIRLVPENCPQRVGLFVEPSIEDIRRVLDITPLDILQLNSSLAAATAIRDFFRIPVWQACSVSDPGDLPVSDIPDGYVLDARPPAGADRPGGNGLAFDWRLTGGWQAPRPWLLAGGLTPDNVAEAVRISGAAAVDVSSGVESAPGKKDPLAIQAFLKAARG
ncbi:phosphoribosylanthranilate isomerase [Acetobacter sp. AN02]|uniref:phosphoribosylanthranilate isomerase n=1 Tax=Acetobacter sp. AN02 TaxID=2894186 RepID=UPI0024341872|nr:phosphoribosylanthranilate isomerase [Acetobacter sp. AN02]MDG6094181.1 phosphoribosylanthranilate isomerase [Acetobacter sp. AN02]